MFNFNHKFIMAKAKLKVMTSELAKLKAACEFTEVVIGDGKTFGDKSLVEVSFKKADQLFELGRVFDSIKPATSESGKEVKNG